MIEVKKIEPGKEVYCKGRGLNCNECKKEKCLDSRGKLLIEDNCKKLSEYILEISEKR